MLISLKEVTVNDKPSKAERLAALQEVVQVRRVWEVWEVWTASGLHLV